MKNVVQILNRILKSFKLEMKYQFWKWGTIPNLACSRTSIKYTQCKGARYYSKEEHEKRVKSFLKLVERAP